MIQYINDEHTGLPIRANVFSGFESSVVTYDKNGMAISEMSNKNYGSFALRSTQKSILCDLNTGLYKKIVENTSLETREITYNLQGIKTSAKIARTFGLSGTRSATVTYTANANTGITQSAVETSSAEIKSSTYDANGLITKMTVTRRYGPSDKRSASFIYTTCPDTGLIMRSQEKTTYETKTLEHAANGIAHHGTVIRTTGLETMRNFKVEILANQSNGLYISEVYSNEYFHIELNYDSQGVPIKRTTIEYKAGRAISTISNLLPGDEVGMTDVVAAAAKDVEKSHATQKRKALSSAAEELPPAKLEYEFLGAQPIPISAERLGIQKMIDLESH